jgi:hypothetical protein
VKLYSNGRKSILKNIKQGTYMESVDLLEAGRKSREEKNKRRGDAKRALVAILASTPKGREFNPTELAANVAGVTYTDAQMAYFALKTSCSWGSKGGLNMEDPFVASTLRQDPLVIGDRIIPQAELQTIVAMKIEANVAERALRRGIEGLGR